MSALRSGGPSVYGLAPGSEVGGELYERELVRRLPGCGVEVAIGMPAGHGLEPTPGVRALRLPWPRHLHWTWAPLVWGPWAAWLVHHERLDVLRAPSVRWSGPALLLARGLVGRRARGRRVPVVIHHHHFEPRWSRLEAWILRRADAVITVSEHSRVQLIAAGVPADRIRLAHNGVSDPGPAAPEPPATWPGPGLRLLYLGRLEARKRPELAIRALAALRIPASLVIAGDGPQRPALQALAAELGVADRVRLLGRVGDARKWALYDGAELLLFGSGLEGFGLVVAEAQARGLPVIAARGTASAEALRDGVSGRLVAPTPVAFAAAIADLADPARRARMGEAGRAHAARFSWEACAEATAVALREVCGADVAVGDA